MKLSRIFFFCYIIFCFGSLSSCGPNKDDNSTPEALGASILYALADNNFDQYAKYVYTIDAERNFLQNSDMEETYKASLLESLDRDFQRNHKYVIGGFKFVRDFMISEGVSDWSKLEMTYFKQVLEEDTNRTYARDVAIGFSYNDDVLKGEIAIEHLIEYNGAWYISSQPNAMFFGNY